MDTILDLFADIDDEEVKINENFENENNEDKGFCDKNQILLFEELEDWQKEWQGMPEFVQEDLQSYKSVIVHFKTQKDMLDFCELVKQRITSKTQSIWYPTAQIDRYVDKRYIDES